MSTSTTGTPSPRPHHPRRSVSGGPMGQRPRPVSPPPPHRLDKVPATLGLEGGLWFPTRHGIRALLVADERTAAVAVVVIGEGLWGVLPHPTPYLLNSAGGRIIPCALFRITVADRAPPLVSAALAAPPPSYPTEPVRWPLASAWRRGSTRSAASHSSPSSKSDRVTEPWDVPSVPGQCDSLTAEVQPGPLRDARIGRGRGISYVPKRSGERHGVCTNVCTVAGTTCQLRGAPSR
jgi:hypothetical protein